MAAAFGFGPQVIGSDQSITGYNYELLDPDIVQTSTDPTKQRVGYYIVEQGTATLETMKTIDLKEFISELRNVDSYYASQTTGMENVSITEATYVPIGNNMMDNTVKKWTDLGSYTEEEQIEVPLTEGFAIPCEVLQAMGQECAEGEDGEGSD